MSADYQIDGIRAMVKVDITANLSIENTHRLLLHLAKDYPQSLTDFVGMTNTGQREDTRTQPKGLFTRTTYADKLENETESGYRAIAGRMLRNIVRNHDELTTE